MNIGNDLFLPESMLFCKDIAPETAVVNIVTLREKTQKNYTPSLTFFKFKIN